MRNNKEISPLRGTIFNIQKFSIHDGNGIRTLVFMKGCPLACTWCSNPESQSFEPEIMDVKVNCTYCGRCYSVCEAYAIDKKTFDIDRERCIRCGKCAKFCYANAKKMVGKTVTVIDLMKEIDKDRVFYRNSGGGVTIGGGEPTFQHEFVAELLKRCKQSSINTSIETCGFVKWEDFREILEYTDHVFMDLKCMNSEMHKKLTGVSNEIILKNAANAANMGKEIVFRLPLIPGINDGTDNVIKTGEFVADLTEKNPKISLELLPFHDFGRDKYKWLNKEYKHKFIAVPDEGYIDRYKKILKKLPVKVI